MESRQFDNLTAALAAATSRRSFMSVVLGAAGGWLGVSAVRSPAIAAEGQPRIPICHAGMTILVPAAAADAHVREHGDALGECGTQPPPEPFCPPGSFPDLSCPPDPSSDSGFPSGCRCSNGACSCAGECCESLRASCFIELNAQQEFVREFCCEGGELTICPANRLSPRANDECCSGGCDGEVCNPGPLSGSFRR
jgi:hypothetical protein